MCKKLSIKINDVNDIEKGVIVFNQFNGFKCIGVSVGGCVYSGK